MDCQNYGGNKNWPYQMIYTLLPKEIQVYTRIQVYKET